MQIVKAFGLKDNNYRKQLKKDPRDKYVTLEDGLLYRKNRLWIPEALRREVIESEHDTKVASHMGMEKPRSSFRSISGGLHAPVHRSSPD